MIDYLAIGHITVDRLPGGPTVGGTVAYASSTAVRLGLRAAIVTTAGEELDWSAHLQGVEIARHPASETTTFENSYANGHRIQRILALSGAVPTSCVPQAWASSAIVHLAPVAHEVDGAFPKLFPGSLIGLSPQGLLRHWDRTGLVRQWKWTGDDALLAGSRVVVLSEEDLAGDPSFLSRCLDRTPIVILTRGAQGATLFVHGQPSQLPAFPVNEIDPTGAGDVFAAAFLIELRRTADPSHSAAFACCAASFAVERPGLEGVPDRRSVEQRLARYRSK